MFHSARIKLTAYYLLIVMLISVLFSTAIYTIVVREIDRDLRHFNERAGELFSPPPQAQIIDPTYIHSVEQRVLYNLIDLNIIILVVSSVAGYFLAGIALSPIKQMVDEQNRFIADASHELRTPLTSLQTETEVALRDKKLNLSQAKNILQSNLEEIISLQALSDRLLRLARFQNGKKKTVFTPLSLETSISEAIRKVTPLAKAKQISIQEKIGKEKVLGDQQSLVELFIILLDNAIKYSPEKSQVTILVKKTDGKIAIIIEDQGIGIAKEDLETIFNRFYRIEKSRSKQQVSGFGLGLAIAKKIVEEHNGEITVKSAVNKGTQFTVLLPKIG